MTRYEYIRSDTCVELNMEKKGSDGFEHIRRKDTENKCWGKDCQSHIIQ